MTCKAHKYYSIDQIKNNELGGAYSMSWGEQRSIQGFVEET